MGRLPQVPISILPRENSHLIDWLREVWHSLSFDGLVAQESFEKVTTDNTITTVWQFSLPVNSVMVITAYVIGIQSDGSDRCGYKETYTAWRTTGNVTSQQMIEPVNNSVDVFLYESNASTGAAITHSGTEVAVQVQGITEETWKWQGYVEYSILTT